MSQKSLPPKPAKNGGVRKAPGLANMTGVGA